MTKKEILGILKECETNFNDKSKEYYENIKFILYFLENEDEIKGLNILDDLNSNQFIESKLGVTNKNIEENLSKILEALKIWVDMNKKEKKEMASISFKRKKSLKAFVFSIVTLVVVTLILVILDICGVFPYGDELSMALDGIGFVTSLIFFAYGRISDSNEKKVHFKNLQEVEKQTDLIVLSLEDSNVAITESVISVAGDMTGNAIIINGDVFVNSICDKYRANPNFSTDSNIMNEIIKLSSDSKESKNFEISEKVINETIDSLSDALLEKELKQEEIRPVSTAIDGLIRLYEKSCILASNNTILKKPNFVLLRLSVYRDVLSQAFNPILFNEKQSFDDAKEYREKLVEEADIQEDTLLHFEQELLGILKFDNNVARNNAYIKLNNFQKKPEIQTYASTGNYLQKYINILCDTFNPILFNEKQSFDDAKEYREKLVEETDIQEDTLLHFEQELLGILKFDNNVARNNAYIKLNNFIKTYK